MSMDAIGMLIPETQETYEAGTIVSAAFFGQSVGTFIIETNEPSAHHPGFRWVTARKLSPASDRGQVSREGT